METTKIIEALENLSDGELLSVWNDYQRDNSYDREVYKFDTEFFETFFGGRPEEAARAVFFGDVKNWNDSFVIFNGYGNLETSNYLSDLISIADLANHIEANPGNYPEIVEEETEEEDEA